MEQLWQVAVHSPWWVYVLLGYLISIGIKATKTRVISIKVLFIMPVLFTAMSIHTLLVSVKPDLFAISTWSIALLLRAAIGYWQVARTTLKVDRKHGLLQVSGTWSVLIIILMIFAAKYYFSYTLAIDPQRAQQTGFEISLLGISGICTGLFIGKLMCYLYRLKTEPQTLLRPE